MTLYMCPPTHDGIIKIRAIIIHTHTLHRYYTFRKVYIVFMPTHPSILTVSYCNNLAMFILTMLGSKFLVICIYTVRFKVYLESMHFIYINLHHFIHDCGTYMTLCELLVTLVPHKHWINWIPEDIHSTHTPTKFYVISLLTKSLLTWRSNDMYIKITLNMRRKQHQPRSSDNTSNNIIKVMRWDSFNHQLLPFSFSSLRLRSSRLACPFAGLAVACLGGWVAGASCFEG